MCHKKTFLFSIIFTALFWSFFLFAKDPMEIKKITVYGTKTPETQSTEAARTLILSNELQNRIVSIPEVLSEQVGVHLTKYGGLESATSISIRGSSSDEVLILYDGIPLNSALGGGVDLSPFMIDSLESIEVFRGSSPFNYGLFPSAGVVSLKSKELKEGTHGQASFSYGSFNTFDVHTHLSRKLKRFGVLVSHTFSRTDGNFSFLDDNGTPVNTNDDQKVERQNNASYTTHPFIKLSYDFDEKTHLNFITHYIHKDSGVPGMASNQSDEAHVSHTQWLLNLQFKRYHFLHPDVSMESSTYFRAVKDQYADLKGEIGLGGAQDNDEDTTLFGHKLNLEYTLSPSHLFSFFVLYQMERYQPRDFMANPTSGSTSLRHQWNVGLSDEIDLLDHRLFLQPAFWLENIYNNINNNDPSFLGAATYLNTNIHHEVSAKMGVKGVVTSFLTLQSHVSRQFRFPTFSELFGDRGSVVGNPFLDPQKSLNWDVGMTMEYKSKQGWLNKAHFTTYYFERNVDDLIQFQQRVGYARAENVGKAQIRGVESVVNFDFWNHLIVACNYTYQDAKDRGINDGRFLPGRPKHEMDTRIEGRIDQGKLFVSFDWMDANFLDPLNTRIVEDRVLINSGLSVKATPSLMFSFEAKNLTNQQIADVVGFPLPGRSFVGKVQFSK